MNKQLSPPNHPRQLDKDIKIMINNVLFLFPHLGQFSFKLRNDVPKLLKKYYPNHKLYVVYKSSKRLTSLNKYKDCFPTLLSSNVIYKYSRSGCNISEYIIAVSTWVMAKLVIPSQSSTWEHIKQTGHSASLDDFSIIDLSLNRGGCRRRVQKQLFPQQGCYLRTIFAVGKQIQKSKFLQQFMLILKSYLLAAKSYLEGRSLPIPGIDEF